MKKPISFILPLLALSAAAFAQDPPDPAPEPPAAGAEASAADTAAPADAEPVQSYRIAVNFEPNSLDLTPLSAARLDSAAAVFADGKRRRYEVHGYSCPAAGQNKTARLSVQRVERMVEYLMELGVPGENIVTVVNAPKSLNTAKGGCTDDRQVDIISAGARWREQTPAEPDPSEELGTAATDPLKQKPAETEGPERPTAAPAAPPIQPIASEPGKQTVAVYMAGEEPQGAKGVHNIMGGELARVISESDKYIAVDRTEAILQQLDREHAYQRGGAVDDDQIKAIGHQLGVQYLCISDINPVGKRYYLDTRLVDIVTAEIARSVTATSTLKDANEMTRAARSIALELLEAEKTRQEREFRKTVFRSTAIGLDIVGFLSLVYGYIEDRNVVKNTEPVDKTHIENGPEARRAATRRNVAYITGATLIAAGVTIHIVF